MNKPNRRRIRRWVRALRSGKYRQGPGWLCVGDAFCCLGVACDISGLGRWGRGVRGMPYVTQDGEDICFMPSPVQDWFGLDYRYCEFLAGLNDCGRSFDEIADVIEHDYLNTLYDSARRFVRRLTGWNV